MKRLPLLVRLARLFLPHAPETRETEVQVEGAFQ